MSPESSPQRTRQVIYKTEATASSGMVTAMHPLAAEAGVEVLRDAGGNATDAAVATALASGVVEPFMSGLGGCAYAVAYDASTGTTRSFDGSVVTPAAAREDMFELASGDAPRLGLYGWPATQGDAAETGYLSIAVPGALAALEKLHTFSGTLPWRELVAPALRLAKEGFPVDEYVFAQSAASESRLRAFPETTAIFLREDGTARAPSFGPVTEKLRQPELARTLELLGRDGPRAFYEGVAAEEILAFVRAHGGVLRSEDFRNYEAREAPTTRVQYGGHRVDLLPGPSGGTTVALALQVLEGFGLGGRAQDDPERLHLVAEALRLAFADRFRFMADPEAELVPLEALLSPAYAAERREQLDRERALGGDLPPGDPWHHQGGRPPGPTPGGGDAPGQHTTHLNVVDRERNMVALTATLGGRYGSGVTVPTLGVVLNNGMMWFDPEPGRLNSIRPGKRALHAAAPTLVFRGDGRPRLALGSPGARRIMSSVLQVLLHTIDQGLRIQDAILAPRIHCEAEGALQVDARFPPELLASLTARGHRVETQTESFLSSYFGRPTGILVDGATANLHGGAEPYRVSAAVGY